MDLLNCDIRVFPDGESKLTIPQMPHGHCILVHSTGPPSDTNLVHLLSIIHKIHNHVDKITVIIPYLGYARQDKEFVAGEVVTLKVVANILRGTNIDRIITIDIHSMVGLEYFHNATNLTATPELARYFGTKSLERPICVSPDRGGRERAASFAYILGIESLALNKIRDRDTGAVTIKNDNVDVSGRDVILVDDMISTGGSVIKATAFLKEQGCGRVFVACTHALMVDKASRKIIDAGAAEIVSTNTVPGNTAVVDMSGAIHKALIKNQ